MIGFGDMPDWVKFILRAMRLMVPLRIMASRTSSTRAPLAVGFAKVSSAQVLFSPSPAALAALDATWFGNSRRTRLLQQGTRLWHGGVIGPNWPLDNRKGLWTTMNDHKKDRYNGWARDDAARYCLAPYLLEFETRRALRLADLNRHSMKQFTDNFCNGQHDLMKSTVLAWIANHGLDGIVSINGDDDEVVICYPVADLKQVDETPL